MSNKVLTIDTIRPSVLKCQYAVRGEIYLAAEKRIRRGEEVILTNVGNPHALGQKPITFLREVMALAAAPFLLERPEVHQMFKPDAIARAKLYLSQLKGGFGAYQDSRGNLAIRNNIADFIQQRDGTHSRTNPDHIFITNGASDAVKYSLNMVIRGPTDGIMVPIPQYPLYSATIALMDGQMVGYHLNEESGWGLDMAEIERSYNEAVSQGINVRAFVFINPGNPTGNCLKPEELRELAKFCHDKKLVMFADEVYQSNIYQDEIPFTSARSVVLGMDAPYRSDIELFSFHSVSKGTYGECGIRGGYVECTNIDAEVVNQLYKLTSICLSPGVPGQIAVGIMVNPPQPGDASYDQFTAEHQALLESLIRRAKKITDAFNKMEDVTCQYTAGAMYSFPNICLPPAAIKAAQDAGKTPDVFYCLKLLEETGLSTVPGSGFGQKDGTFHFRTTILPSESEFDRIVGLFSNFHKSFMARYKRNGLLLEDAAKAEPIMSRL